MKKRQDNGHTEKLESEQTELSDGKTSALKKLNV